ncbi:low specificity L-threonine aldolase [Paenibacillus donghaensis]|uniref:threonine aldolase family protein n=1 Tax=Paenibacillus donghaensis TaxID=414771 RepID=UPI0018835AD4|nr:beta-eliminating lyase-related protein [Paenibacillus donghaensis]MBE9914634.1 low specificity L-threonine aldolase [Paenibacillus donghaensis]
MSSSQTLSEAFKQAAYRLVGHGARDIQVLKQAIAEVPGNTASDMYGQGKVIEDFQSKMAAYLGKESAVFFPSGTMAQQIALRIWCDEKDLKRVAYHPLCHLEIHEQDAVKELHQIEPILLANKDRLITLKDVQVLEGEISCLLLELPQREIGGQLPPYEELEAISAYCRDKGIRLHLDGARLFEITSYYGKSAAEICALFDSVYVSFYKGIGGIAGAILAGDSGFTEQSKVWKRRHGGDLTSLYPYIISSDYYFDQRIGKMEQYYEEAKELAAYFDGLEGVSVLPEIPVSNMFHVHFKLPKEQVVPILVHVAEATGVGLTGWVSEREAGTCYTEISIGDRYAGVPKEKIREAVRLLDEKMKEAMK